MGPELIPLAPRIWRHEGGLGTPIEESGTGEPTAPQGRVRSDLGQADPDRGAGGKLLSPARRRTCVEHVRKQLDISERHACVVVGHHRSTQRKPAVVRSDEERLTQDIVRLASPYGRYGHRHITALLQRDGRRVNVKRVYRIWRREGLKVPSKQPKLGRLWLNDGSCIRLRPRWKDHV